jgi:hypothetical protein
MSEILPYEHLGDTDRFLKAFFEFSDIDMATDAFKQNKSVLAVVRTILVDLDKNTHINKLVDPTYFDKFVTLNGYFSGKPFLGSKKIKPGDRIEHTFISIYTF